jgi:hypothetical protein
MAMGWKYEDWIPAWIPNPSIAAAAGSVNLANREPSLGNAKASAGFRSILKRPLGTYGIHRFDLSMQKFLSSTSVIALRHTIPALGRACESTPIEPSEALLQKTSAALHQLPALV